jgi:hypothetical protein
VQVAGGGGGGGGGRGGGVEQLDFFLNQEVHANEISLSQSPVLYVFVCVVCGVFGLYVQS